MLRAKYNQYITITEKYITISPFQKKNNNINHNYYQRFVVTKTNKNIYLYFKEIYILTLY